MATISSLFILGAGFSYNAGLPLASDFTSALLNMRGLRLEGPSLQIVQHLKEFVDNTFNNGASTPSDDWPELEDIFTLIDLSANTGHHLGPRYSAATLRVVRRALIVRLIRMLRQRYNKRQENPDDNWDRLEKLFSAIDLETTAALSLNWDTVVEQGLFSAQKVTHFEYGCGARSAHFVNGDLELNAEVHRRQFEILKPHGSINWLYCDACRGVYWLPDRDVEKVAQTLFGERDWKSINVSSDIPKILEPHCPTCHSQALGTRLATFSYRKALDFPMHSATWRRAESLLREANTWIFFGYSMPGADFEFKHLLKRVELSRKKKPRIILITGGNGGERTQSTYKNFFGAGNKTNRIYHHDGLTDSVIADLEKMGVLTKEK